MSGVTLIGNTLPVFTALFIGYIVAGDRLEKVFIFIGFSILINSALKQFIHRPRPDTIYVSKMRFKTHSFPSGHAFGTILAYGFLTYLLVTHLNNPLGYLLGGLIYILIVLVGISRVYLGAHYPTDVIGGWIFGLACLFLATSLT